MRTAAPRVNARAASSRSGAGSRPRARTPSAFRRRGPPCAGRAALELPAHLAPAFTQRVNYLFSVNPFFVAS